MACCDGPGRDVQAFTPGKLAAAMTDTVATQELPSGAAMAADGGRGVPSDAAAVRSASSGNQKGDHHG